jgi:hypothetical protein
MLWTYTLMNFPPIEIIKHYHKIHDIGHKFVLTEFGDEYQNFFKKKCKTTDPNPVYSHSIK